jgi:signal transduction histidine kinase
VQTIQQRAEPCIEIAQIEGERWLIHNSPLLVDDQIVGIIQVARSLADRDRSLQALGGTLLVGSLLTTVIAFGIGWILSEITLRPIHRITQTAQQIGAERDLSRRVAYDGLNDEVGQLATTFNAMLAQLQDAYQQVAHSLETQRSFVADVSHELRTPLTTICGNLALLRRKPPIREEEHEDILADMVAESERLVRLVNDLLTLARADAGRQVRQDRVELGPLIKDICHQARLLEPDREIEYNGYKAAVIADRDALKQVLLILLDNALKHTAGPITVTTNAQAHLVSVSVRDTGPGMDAETCERVFDRFFRADTAQAVPGFGLGLPIAGALVKAQGGSIIVESEVNTGSTFTVTLVKDDT